MFVKLSNGLVRPFKSIVQVIQGWPLPWHYGRNYSSPRPASEEKGQGIGIFVCVSAVNGRPECAGPVRIRSCRGPCRARGQAAPKIREFAERSAERIRQQRWGPSSRSMYEHPEGFVSATTNRTVHLSCSWDPRWLRLPYPASTGPRAEPRKPDVHETAPHAYAKQDEGMGEPVRALTLHPCLPGQRSTISSLFSRFLLVWKVDISFRDTEFSPSVKFLVFEKLLKLTIIRTGYPTKSCEKARYA